MAVTESRLTRACRRRWASGSQGTVIACVRPPRLNRTLGRHSKNQGKGVQ